MAHGSADVGSCCPYWQVRQYLDFFRQSGKFSVAYLNAGGEKVCSCAPPKLNVGVQLSKCYDMASACIGHAQGEGDLICMFTSMYICTWEFAGGCVLTGTGVLPGVRVRGGVRATLSLTQPQGPGSLRCVCSCQLSQGERCRALEQGVCTPCFLHGLECGAHSSQAPPWRQGTNALAWPESWVLALNVICGCRHLSSRSA